MFWANTKVSVETQTTALDHWIIHHIKMRPFSQTLLEGREGRAQEALNIALEKSKNRSIHEKLRIKRLELEHENACLKHTAEALISNIRRETRENMCESDPQWFYTNYWRIKPTK